MKTLLMSIGFMSFLLGCSANSGTMASKEPIYFDGSFVCNYYNARNEKLQVVGDIYEGDFYFTGIRVYHSMDTVQAEVGTIQKKQGCDQ